MPNWRTNAEYSSIALAIVIAILLVVTLVGGSSSRACSSCHSMQPYADALSSSKHSGVACYDCHLTAGVWSWPSFKTTEMARMYPGEITGRGLTGPVARLGRARCLACHENVLDGPLTAHGLRIDHATCATTDSCDDCHSASAHGSVSRWPRQPVMADCTACHSASGAPTECSTCHDERSKTVRVAKGPWQITHGPEWEKTHGMGDLRSCGVCHPKDYCARCHGIALPHPLDFPKTHGRLAQEQPASCDACHDRALLCDPCHGIPMPHPATFRADHSTIATSRGDERCMKCHYESDCRACHEAHTHPGSTDGTLKETLPKPGGRS
ncbi:MAG: hypothetical protein ABFC80_06995 [Coriobacteriales bacterium]|nr:hypothetical protein [Actinomycetes bacterium]